MNDLAGHRHEWERGSATHERLILFCAACGVRLVENDPLVEDWKGVFNSCCAGRANR